MSQISRYIFRQLVVSGAIVLVSLTCAIWLTQSLRFVELIVSRGLTVGAYLHLTLLLLPSFLGVLLPISLFVAVLFTYHRLTSDSELVILRAIGLGPVRLAAPALVLASIVALAGYALNLYFLPVSYRTFKDLEYDVRNDYSAVLLREGVFNTVSDGITVYIRSREANGELHGVLIHDNRDKQKPVTVMAERGTLALTDEGPRLILVDGNRQEVERDSSRLRLLYFERYTADLGKVGERADQRWREPRERFLGELFYIGPSEIDRALAPKLYAEGHNRLVSPLLAIAFVLIALAGLLSGDFNRRGQGRRVALAVMTAVAVQMLALVFYNLAGRSTSLFFLLYLNTALAIGLPAWWLFRLPRPRRRPAESWAAAS